MRFSDVVSFACERGMLESNLTCPAEKEVVRLAIARL